MIPLIYLSSNLTTTIVQTLLNVEYKGMLVAIYFARRFIKCVHTKETIKEAVTKYLNTVLENGTFIFL